MSLVTQRPVPGMARPYRFPSFTRTRLANGMTVIECPTPGRPIGSAILMVGAGAIYEPRERAGVAALAASVLTEGTALRDGAAFAEAADALGAEIDATAGWEVVQVSVRAPAGRMEAALELAGEAVLRPTFPKPEVDRLRSERLDEIRQQLASPMTRADRAFIASIYTERSAYARDREGTLESVEPLTRDDVEAFWRAHADPTSATLIVAGDLPDVNVPDAAERAFGAWPSANGSRTRAPVEPLPLEDVSVTLIDRPGSVQSNFVLGHVGIARGDPDEFAVDLMGYALGGSFSSRINSRLREEKGYTYGARASFDARRERGPFYAHAPVETSVTVPALVDMLDVIRGVREGGITREELDEAREHETGVFALRFETPDSIANGIAEIVVYDLGDDYFDSVPGILGSLEVGDAAAAAMSRLQPDRCAVVIVGDAGSILEPLREAGFRVRIVEESAG